MDEKIIKAKLDADAAMVVKHDVYEAGLDARRIVEDARRQAQTIFEEGVRERDALVEAGRQEGFRSGLAEWGEALAELRAARQSLHNKCETELVRLAVRIAEKIIGEELRTRPETIVSIVRECLRGLRQEQNLRIRVNRRDLEQVEQRLALLQETVVAGRRVQVAPDAGVSPGGCIVETETGIIDARLETQLKCLEDILVRTAVRR
jgi:type III secretion system HrpE/YscL family protein